MDEGVFPRLLVTMKLPAGLSLIDGSHRMAAFEMVVRCSDMVSAFAAGMFAL